MTHRRNTARFTLTAALAASTFVLAVSTGCEPPPPPPPPVVVTPKYEPPPPPPLTSIKDLMAQYDIDPRVNLPEDRAPSTDVQRVAVLRFFDAFARGNAEGLKPMLSAPDQFQLENMVERGVFANTTKEITRIDVRCGRQDGSDCALAVFHVGEDFEPQLWVYAAGASVDDTAEFDSVATPPGIMEKLSGDNWIAAWYEVLRLELAKADEPDAVIEIPQTDFTSEQSVKEESPGVSQPSAPGGLPGRRLPGAPIDRPRAPGFGNK